MKEGSVGTQAHGPFGCIVVWVGECVWVLRTFGVRAAGMHGQAGKTSAATFISVVGCFVCVWSVHSEHDQE